MSDGSENNKDEQIEVESSDRNLIRGRVSRPVYDETISWGSKVDVKDAKAYNNNSNNSNGSSSSNNNDRWRSGRPSHFNDPTGNVNSSSNLHTSNVNSSIGVGINTGEHAYLPSTLLSSQSQSPTQYSGNSSNSNSTSSTSTSSSVSSGLTSRDSYRITSADNALLYNSAIKLRNDKENGNDEDDLMNFLLDDTNF